MDGMSFLTLVVIVFALVMLVLGVFSIYFGSRRNMIYGGIMTVAGLIVGSTWIYLVTYSNIFPFCDVAMWGTIYSAMIDIVGIFIGAFAAIIIFLATVLKN